MGSLTSPKSARHHISGSMHHGFTYDAPYMLTPGTLGHPAEGFLTPHSLLMPAFSPAPPPHLDHSDASLVARRSPTHPSPWTYTYAWVTLECHGFGDVLEPRYIVGAESLDQ